MRSIRRGLVAGTVSAAALAVLGPGLPARADGDEGGVAGGAPLEVRWHEVGGG